ncbi:hypothetical protein [Streptomyces sp. NBC_00063]|uniref:hypothetical protein n=1 Tax=Streptomyces sp. NBC_00063 TaxID=2975638 RepID=UPI003D718A28
MEHHRGAIGEALLLARRQPGRPHIVPGHAPRGLRELQRAAGFNAVEWVPLQVSEAGIREYGEDFWADVLANPPLEMPRCRA